MKVLLFGNNAKNILKLIQKFGFEVVSGKPDTIISYGGDGTLLACERLYPGIPKLPVRDSLICKKCSRHEDEVVLKALADGKLILKEHEKLQTKINSKIYYALNDFVVRNSHPTHTIRFTTSLGSGLLIGDGIVVATYFGSTGYFKSITKQSFPNGFGVAFNNTTQSLGPKYLSKQDRVFFELKRGRAILSFDNNPEIFDIPEGGKLIFQLSDQAANIYEDTSLRCPNCKINR